jgi:fumarylpyruvate hydrolase
MSLRIEQSMTTLPIRPMNFAIEPPAVTSLPIAQSEQRFPVGRIFCVGRNYAEHAREMGHDAKKSPPFFFMKPANAIVADGGAFHYPAASMDVHHEVELVVALRSGGRRISPDQSMLHIFGYAVGLDMTRRDLQAEAKRLQRPWECAKAFEGSAPIGPVSRIGESPDLRGASISLMVNGETRQHALISDMIWDVASIVAHLSDLFELHAGDLIMTGTPAGVGAVQVGDRLQAEVEGLKPLHVDVAAPVLSQCNS